MRTFSETRFWLLLLFLGTSVQGVASELPDSVAIAFVQQPPGRLEFSNNTRTLVNCTVRGHPRPSVKWTLTNGVELQPDDQPQLLSVLANGSLVFHPFRPEQYRQDVHAASYRCQATSPLGVIVSREMWVRAVVVQNYEVQVYDEFVITGNTGVLKCHIPSFVTDYVTVTDWLCLDPHSSETTKIVDQSGGGRYTVLPSGELHVHSVTSDDRVSSYSCRTYHRLTGESKQSSTAGRLVVTAPQGSVPPRITDTRTTIEVEEGSLSFLPCAAQGYPVPSYTWFVKYVFDRWEALPENNRVRRKNGSLIIKETMKQDSAVYMCVVNNSIGSEKAETALTVTVPLSVRVQPSHQVVDLGSAARIQCSVSGHPVSALIWLRNGRQVSLAANPNVPHTDILHIDALGHHDIGLYQCFAKNGHQVVNAVAQIRVGDAFPELHQRFPVRVLHPGSALSLSCSASGNPQPEVTWMLDDSPAPVGPRHSVGASVGGQGWTVGFLNVSGVRVEDGGVYRCVASSRLGTVTHSERIDVYGPPYIRASRTISAMASSDLLIKCPYAGYPIETVYWEKDSLKLPLNRRHRVFANGTMQVLNVQPRIDAGHYTCVVQGANGQTAARDIQVAVLIPPGIAPFSFQGEQFVEGMRIRATCYVSKGDLPISISWLKDGRHLVSDAELIIRVIDEYSNLLTIDSVTAEHGGNYTCQATNSVAIANYTAQLVVNVPPKWLTEPSDTKVLVDDSAVLNCSAFGLPPPMITWQKAEGTFPGDYREVPLRNSRFVHFDNGSLLLGNLQEADEGHYLCQASNGVGAGLSRVIHVAVNVPPRFENVHINHTLSEGEEARMTCAANGDLPIKITWLMNGDRLMSEQMLRYTINERGSRHGLVSELVIRNADSRDTAVFSCVAANLYGRKEASHQLVVQERPSAPANLKVTEVSSRIVRLTWTPLFDGNTQVTRYVVQYKKTSDAWATSTLSQYTTGTETAASVARLTPDSSYHFRIVAENRVGLSLPSDVIEGRTHQEAPGGVPQNLQVDATDSQTLKVTWLPPKQELVYGDITGYIIGYRLNNSTDTIVERKVDANAAERRSFQAVLNNLKKFAKYDVTVRAYNSRGHGPAASIEAASTEEDVPTKAPRRISCSAISSQSLRLIWEAPPTGDINGALLGYKVYYKPLSKWSGVGSVQTKLTGDSQLTLHGLDINANYSVQISAYTRIGDGVKSEAITCATDEDVPDSPADIKALVMTTDAILVVWRQPLRVHGSLLRHTVYIRTLDRNSELAITKHPVVSSQTYFEAVGVSNRYRYEFWVTSSTSVGEGKSTKVVTQTPKTTVPAKVAAFDQQITTRWRSNVTLPCRTVGMPRPEVEWKIGTKRVDVSERLQVLPNDFLIINTVRSSDTSNYTCQARNLHGSDSVTYSLVVLAPPSPPRFLVGSTSLHSVSLTWDAVVDGGSPIVGYSLSYRRDRGEWEEVQVEPEVRSFTLDALLCGTTYELYMTAYSSVGPGKPSDIVRVDTKGAAPSAPKRESVISSDASSVTLALDGWHGDGCPILYFVIDYRKSDDTDWLLLSNDVKPQSEPYVLENLQANSRYVLRVTAHNHAGATVAEYAFATRTYFDDAAVTSHPTVVSSSNSEEPPPFYLNLKVTLPVIFCCLLIVVAFIVTCFVLRPKRAAPIKLEPQSHPLKYQLVVDNRHNGEILTKDRSPVVPLNSCPAMTKNELADDVNPYATYQVAVPHVDYGELQQEQHMKQIAVTNLQNKVSNYASTNRNDSKISYRPEAMYTEETVPDLLYHSNESSSSGELSSEAEDLQEIIEDHMYFRQQLTHAELQRCLKSFGGPNCQPPMPSSTADHRHQILGVSPTLVSDYYALPESDAGRSQVMKELKTVIEVNSNQDRRPNTGSSESRSGNPRRHWQPKNHEPKQTVL